MPTTGFKDNIFMPTLIFILNLRSRHAREESRKMRGAELYDSIVVKSDSESDQRKEKNETENKKISILMPGEMGGTMSKAMSYDVNPIYSL